MTPFDVTVLSVTLNAAGIVPSANNHFPVPNVTEYLPPERIHQIMLDECVTRFALPSTHKSAMNGPNKPSCENESVWNTETKPGANG